MKVCAAGGTASAAVHACADDSSTARVMKGVTAKEPALYAVKDAKKCGVIKDLKTLPPGSVTIRTVFHVITATTPSPAREAELRTMVAAQLDVLNVAYSGGTASDVPSFNSPFRFTLAPSDVNLVTNPTWATVAPGKVQKDMKAALREGDSQTLNVYTGDIGGGLLEWAYFPKDYNNGRDVFDGVVILDESMPGGDAAP